MMTMAKLRHKAVPLFITLALATMHIARAEPLTVLHVGDQETWLISAQGNLRDDAEQKISWYGGIDRLAAVITRARAAAADSTVITLNAGDVILPGPRFTASLANLATAYNGGQDFYDAIASRHIGFDAIVFGNHEFDGDKIGKRITRFVEVCGSTYLSVNLDFGATPEFAALKASGKVAPSKIIRTKGGKKVGVIGATTPLLPLISSAPEGIMKQWNSAYNEAQNMDAVITMIQAEIDRLRQQEGVTAVILVSHLQTARNEQTRVIPALKGVDLVISGGGHELMVDDDKLISGGVAPTFTTHPVFVTSAEGKPVPMVTGHFGNRYVGEIKFTLDDTTGRISRIDGTRMMRVSGHPDDADRVEGDPVLNASVIKPVLAYLDALNAKVIGSTAVRLNGPTHVPCAAAPCKFTAGVRNAETGLGSLIADAMRFAGQTDIAIQNGGGIRTGISKTGKLSMGDTFNVLPFTNLVKRAPVMNASQLKEMLEHALSRASPTGAVNGRFAQVSGMQVIYDSRLPARDSARPGSGERVRRVVLDDGTVLVDQGLVVNYKRNVSFTTIDFTAAGGDDYPFAVSGVAFEDRTHTVSYQEALANFISTAKSAGGLRRDGGDDGDEVTRNMYGEENPFDLQGRLVDLAVGVKTPGVSKKGTPQRDVIVGTEGDDVIIGGGGADLLTGGAGSDRFVYTRLSDAGDVITDFTPYADILDLSGLLQHLRIDSVDPVAEGYVLIKDVTGGVSVQIDVDGARGPKAARPLLTLKGLTARQIAPVRDFAL